MVSYRLGRCIYSPLCYFKILWRQQLFLVLGLTFILIQWYTLLAGLASKVARKDSLARFLENRPDQKDLENRNILHTSSEDEASTDRHDKVVKLGRKLSMRPTAEELENRNILHHGMLGFYILLRGTWGVFYILSRQWERFWNYMYVLDVVIL